MPKRGVARKREREMHTKKQPTTKALAKRVKRLERLPELKYELVGINYTYPAGTTGDVLNLTTLSQGDDQDNRVGNEVIAKYYNMRIRMQKGYGFTGQSFRTIIYWDTQLNQTGVPYESGTTGEIGETLLDFSLGSSPMFQLHNPRTSQRYKVLYDKVYTFPNYLDADLQYKYVNLNFNLHNARIKFADSANDSSGLVSRALLMMIIGNGSGGQYAFNGMFKYTDS